MNSSGEAEESRNGLEVECVDMYSSAPLEEHPEQTTFLRATSYYKRVFSCLNIICIIEKEEIYYC